MADDYQLGLGHLLGSDGVESSVSLALKCFERAADSGHADAQYSLAACYLTDDPATGRCADPIAAVRWLERAAEQEHAAAQHELGLCFAAGTGVTQDLSKAASLYSEAAAQGFGMAQCALAECLLRGIGVPVDIDRAQELFRSALAQGSVPDRSMSYSECLSAFPHDTAASVGWLDGQAAQHRRFEALLQIGVIDGDSLLDVGCGVGHLWEYCNCRPAGTLSVEYTGLDCHAAAIEAAARRHSCTAADPEPEGEPEAGACDSDKNSVRGGDSGGYALASAASASVVSPRWFVGRAPDLVRRDPAADMPTKQYDWVLLSGTFNLGVTEAEMWSTLRSCLLLCCRGVAFNLLLRADAAGLDGRAAENSTAEPVLGAAEKDGSDNDRPSAELHSNPHGEATFEDYSCYEPSAITLGIRSLLKELGLNGNDHELHSSTDESSWKPVLPRIVVTLGKNYDVPYDFTVHVIL